jgi:plasmid maintenance system antidote protein VapI
MISSQTPLLAEISAGHDGAPISSSTRAYFQQRLRNRIFNFLLKKFAVAQDEGLSKAKLARRIGKTPDIINRWLGTPSNLTIDTISDLLLGIAAEELNFNSSFPFAKAQSNYSLYGALCEQPRQEQKPIVGAAKMLNAEGQNRSQALCE